MYVFSEGTRTSFINNSGSILFKLRRPVLSLQLISSLLAFASFFQYEDILESFPEDTRLACYLCLVFSFLYDLKGHISVYTLYVRGVGGSGDSKKCQGYPLMEILIYLEVLKSISKAQLQLIALRSLFL